MIPAASPAVLPNATSRRARWPFGPALVACLALIAVVETGAAGRPEWSLIDGPGLTLDEGFYVSRGVDLIRKLRAYGLASLHPATIREIWGAKDYTPDHPPLAWLAMGVVHEALHPGSAEAVSDLAARPESACAFALTVFFVGWATQRWFGGLAGCVAAVSVTLLPRSFGHAHLATLESTTSLTYVACVLFTADRCRAATGSGSWRAFAIGGALWGAALLTKIQAVLIAPAVAIWWIAHWKVRALPRGLVFALVGTAVFFAGWPWLWLDPLGHVRDYFARATDRQTLYMFYGGTRWADADVPWHAPWVLFAVTVPVGLQFLGSCGLALRTANCPQADGPALRGWTDSRLQLVGLAMLIPLVVFSIPGVRLYDGERLFGVVYPLWGVFIGRGGALAYNWLAREWRPREAALAGICLLASQAWGIAAYHPAELSYYNLAVGGLRGADRLGFERSYWAEDLTESVQRQIVSSVPSGATIDVAPVLHPGYLPHLIDQSPLLRAAGIRLDAYDDRRPDRSRYVLLFHRKGDPWASLAPPPGGTQTLVEFRRAGIPLVSLYRLPSVSAADR